jgi:hypothetical protein
MNVNVCERIMFLDFVHNLECLPTYGKLALHLLIYWELIYHTIGKIYTGELTHYIGNCFPIHWKLN